MDATSISPRKFYFEIMSNPEEVPLDLLHIEMVAHMLDYKKDKNEAISTLELIGISLQSNLC